MPKQRYRSEMGKIHAILEAAAKGGNDGVQISTITHKANLTHEVVVESCSKLEAAGLIESFKRGRNRIVIITHKGLCIFVELRRFKNIMEGMNLRY